MSRWAAGSNQLVVKVTGHYGSTSIARAVQLNHAVHEHASAVFSYGLASNGGQVLSGGILKRIPDASRGRFLSTNMAVSSPLSVSGSAVVTGDVSFTSPTATVTGSGSIGGTTTASLWPVHTNVTAPEFPAVDPTPYANTRPVSR
jgi:hypothetical protein